MILSTKKITKLLIFLIFTFIIVLGGEKMEKNSIDYIFNEIASKTIKEYREKKQLSLEDVVKKMKNPISRQALFKYENNQARMKESTFIDLCNALNIDPKDVFYEINEKALFSAKKDNITEKEYSLELYNTKTQKKDTILFSNEANKNARSKIMLNISKKEWEELNNDLKNQENILNKVSENIYSLLKLDFEYQPNTEAEMDFDLNSYSNIKKLYDTLISLNLIKKGRLLKENELENINDFINNNSNMLKQILDNNYKEYLKEWNNFTNSPLYEKYISEIES